MSILQHEHPQTTKDHSWGWKIGGELQAVSIPCTEAYSKFMVEDLERTVKPKVTDDVEFWYHPLSEMEEIFLPGDIEEYPLRYLQLFPKETLEQIL